jgi:hypothetical protein
MLLPDHLPIANRVAESNLSAVRRLENALARPLPEAGVNFDRLISDVEIDLINKASRQCSWNQSRTAELLQMKRDKLRYRMKIYEIESERKRGPGRPRNSDTRPDYPAVGPSALDDGHESETPPDATAAAQQDSEVPRRL